MAVTVGPALSWYDSSAQLSHTSVSINVEFRGLIELIAVMVPTAAEKAMKKYLDDGAKKIHKRLEHRMPIETGAARGSIRVENKGDMARWIGTDYAGSPRHPGFPYPAVLAVGGRYHYRAGPFSGGATAGYHERAAEDSMPDIEAGLSKLAEEVARQLVP
jgi:hypothetical protein